MATVKKYEPKYFEDVRGVCINTGPENAKTDPKMRKYILSAYCDYYVEREPENAFVLVDDEDRGRGYAFCGENFKNYVRGFRPYLKKVFQTGFGRGLASLGEISLYRLFSKKYPSHLHIDLDEGFRGKGDGSRMISALTRLIKDKGSRGVMLIVGSGNSRGINFYKKNGFRVLLSAFGGTAMAKEL